MKLTSVLLLAVAGTAVFAQAEQRAIRATRADEPPTLDGRLDDPCWQKAEVAGDFRRFTEGTPAHEPSEARILYDDTHLYFGFRCLEPGMDLVRRDVKGNPSTFNYAHGNTVEVFLDPGASKEHYWQFMVNTNGSTETHLATHDVLHLGDLPWRAKAFLGDDFFSVEVAIPFALLHVRPEAGVTWGVNFCRARQIGKQESAYMYSSWQPMRGSFLRPELFGALRLDADLSRFMYGVTVPEEIRPGQRCLIAVSNLTGKPARIRVGVTLASLNGSSRNDQSTLVLGMRETVKLDLGLVRPGDDGAELRVEITDAASGELLFLGATQTIDETQ